MLHKQVSPTDQGTGGGGGERERKRGERERIDFNAQSAMTVISGRMEGGGGE